MRRGDGRMDILTCIVISALTAAITTVVLVDRFLNGLLDGAKEIVELSKKLEEKCRK